MGLFSSDNDGGCTSHHYPDIEQARETFGFTSKAAIHVDGVGNIPVLTAERESRVRCLHEGCGSKKLVGVTDMIVPKNLLVREARAWNAERAHDYAERLREFADEIDPDVEKEQ